jgi:hypothetical protein
VWTAGVSGKRKGIVGKKGEKGKTSEMTSDMIAFGARRDTIFPFTCEAEVICAPPAYVIGA